MHRLIPVFLVLSYEDQRCTCFIPCAPKCEGRYGREIRDREARSARSAGNRLADLVRIRVVEGLHHRYRALRRPEARGVAPVFADAPTWASHAVRLAQ